MLIHVITATLPTLHCVGGSTQFLVAWIIRATGNPSRAGMVHAVRSGDRSHGHVSTSRDGARQDPNCARLMRYTTGPHQVSIQQATIWPRHTGLFVTGRS